MSNFKKYLNEGIMKYDDAIEDIAFDLSSMRYSSKLSKEFNKKVKDIAYTIGKIYNKDPIQIERYIYSHMNTISKE